MNIETVTKVIDRRYKPAAVLLIAIGGCAWLMVAAAGTFSDMVDKRALAVVERYSARPLAEHEEMKRQVAELRTISAEILKSQELMDRNLTRLMTIQEEQDKARERRR